MGKYQTLLYIRYKREGDERELTGDYRLIYYSLAEAAVVRTTGEEGQGPEGGWLARE